VDPRQHSQEEPIRTSTPPKAIVTSPIVISPRLNDRFSPTSPQRILPSERALSPTGRLGRAWGYIGEGGMVFGSPREEPNMNQAAWARRAAEGGRDF